ncbi:MAG: fibronectin type III domain-containing protein [Clostridiales bacterium]|nr:fibronectin type III domain-containing protein [Clostridiales bacterium]
MKTYRGRRLAIAATIALCLCLLAPLRAQSAAVQPIGYLRNQTLVIGNEVAPEKRNYAGDDDQALLTWPMDKKLHDDNSFAQGTYTLSYYPEDETQIVATFSKRDRIAQVAFDVLKWNALSSSYESANLGFYLIYNGSIYMPAKDFIDQKLNISDAEFGAVSAARPIFNVSPGAGFSFEYSGFYVNFLWDKDNNMYFNADKIAPGNIVSFNMDFSDAFSSTSSGALTVLNGLSKDTFRSIPFSNGTNGNLGVTQGNEQDTTFRYDPDLAAYERDLDLTKNPPDLPPGSPECEIVLRFDPPKSYDPASHKFEMANGPVPVVIKLDHEHPAHSFQISLEDVTSINAGSSAMNSGDFTLVSAQLIPTLGRYEVRIGAMTPALLYETATLSVALKGLKVNDTVLRSPEHMVYTFTSFAVEAIEGKHYVSVKPFEGYPGYYLLKSGSTSSVLSSSVSQYSDGVSPVLLPLSADSATRPTLHYQIFFSPLVDFPANIDTNRSAHSQIMIYRPDPASETIGIPNNFKVLSHRLYEDKNSAKGEYGTLEFTVQWDIASEEGVESLLGSANEATIVYQLNKALAPSNDASTPYKKLEVRLTRQGTEIYSEIVDITDAANPVVVSPLGPIPFRSEATGLAMSRVFLARASFEAPAALSHAENITTNPHFLYPNVYFLSVKPLSANGIAVDSATSLFSSMTLSDLSGLALPPPQDFAAGNPVVTSSQISFDVSWRLPGNKISEYLQTLNPALYPQLFMNLYITQDEAKMRDQLLEGANRDIALKVPYQPGKTLFMSDMGSGTLMCENGDLPLDALRAGSVLQISGIGFDQGMLDLIASGSSLAIEFTIDGLDKNQKYYVCADLSAKLYEDRAGTKLKRWDWSEFSSMAAQTTKSDLQESDPAGQSPPAPVIDKKNVSLSSAVIFWKPVPPMGPGDVIEYEIIRLRGDQMPPELLDTKTEFVEFLDTRLANFNKAAWRTDRDVLEVFSSGNFTPESAIKAVINRAINPIEFTDYGLSPNAVYFFYVRTARLVEGSRVVSVWSGLSLTTIPVQSPKNLRAELDWEEYNPKTEIVISFDAPLIDVSLLETEFSLQYQLGTSKGWADPVTISPGDMLSDKSKEAGYTKFYTKLSGLFPGTLYSIRVRMIDQSGGASLYTNLIQVKTDTDKDSYEDKREADNWLDRLKELLNEIFKTPYWATREDREKFEAVYRPDMLLALMNKAPGNLIPLPAGNARNSTYYLPASYVNGANGEGKGFIFTKDGYDLILSPNALNTAANEAAISIGHKLHSGQANDWYLKITVDWKELGLEKTAAISASLVGSLVPAEQWSDEMLDALAIIVKNDLEDEKLYDFIFESVSDGVMNHDLALAIDAIERSAKRAVLRVAASRLRPSLRYSYNVKTFDRPLMVVAKGFSDQSRINAARMQGSRWIPIPVADFFSGKAAITYAPGLCRFSSRPIEIPAIYSIKGAGSMRRLIATYGLDDFFGSTRFHMSQSITRIGLANSACRLLGAPDKVDPFKWLKAQHGADISAKDPASYASWQEAAYFAMLVYSGRTNLLQESLEKADPVYRASPTFQEAIDSAAALGIAQPNPNPRAAATISDFLQMLEAIDKKIGL